MDGTPVLSFDKARVDPTVKLTDGTAGGNADGTPVAVWKSIGKGGAFLLNCQFSSYPKLGVADTPEAAAARVQELFRQAGVVPAVQLVQPGTSRRVRNVEVIRWQDGQVQIVALFRQGGLKEKAQVRLPRSFYVYDLRNRKSLGRKRLFTTTIIPNRASFFVLCPGAAPTGKLHLSASRVRPGTVVTGTLTVPRLQGLHAFRMRVRAGNADLDWFNQNVLVGRGGATFPLPIAYNDPLGTYQVRAIDLFTNAPVTARLEVRPVTPIGAR